jgi:hypothetical protein
LIRIWLLHCCGFDAGDRETDLSALSARLGGRLAIAHLMRFRDIATDELAVHEPRLITCGALRRVTLIDDALQ